MIEGGPLRPGNLFAIEGQGGSRTLGRIIYVEPDTNVFFAKLLAVYAPGNVRTWYLSCNARISGISEKVVIKNISATLKEKLSEAKPDQGELPNFGY